MAEVTARTGVPSDQPVDSTQLNRVADALRTQQTFDRAQVAWLMSAAQQWGYDVGYEDGQRDELALACVAATYAYTGSFAGTAREIGKRDRRQEADATARLPRVGDHQGGPVEWGEVEDMRVAA